MTNSGSHCHVFFFPPIFKIFKFLIDSSQKKPRPFSHFSPESQQKFQKSYSTIGTNETNSIRACLLFPTYPHDSNSAYSSLLAHSNTDGPISEVPAVPPSTKCR